MTRKSILILAAVLALVAVGIFTVSAQSDTTTTTCPGMGQEQHGSMMGSFGNGMMSGADGDTMMAAAAKALGLDTTAFIEKLHSGQTLADIAKAQNVDVQAIYDAMSATAKEHMDALVKAGTITQAQADAHLTWMKDNLATMPMFAGGAGSCTGNGMGMTGNHMHGMMGSGMMEHGMGMMGNGMMGDNS
ncbi:MAG: hypothetical protein LCI00_08735 [Chloroflexi bacterium]|nr:hypothetical protein [Chloroflexota bacterium]